MNHLDFTQPGGFPLDQEILQLLQDNGEMAANSALLGGSQYIMKGCLQTGTNVTNGIVFINNEILPFVGGTATIKVMVVETITGLTYEDGSVKGVQKVRYATFGDDGVTTIMWADFKRIPGNSLIDYALALNSVLTPLAASFALWQVSTLLTGSTIINGTFTTLKRNYKVSNGVVTMHFECEATFTGGNINISIPLPVTGLANQSEFGSCRFYQKMSIDYNAGASTKDIIITNAGQFNSDVLNVGDVFSLPGSNQTTEYFTITNKTPSGGISTPFKTINDTVVSETASGQIIIINKQTDIVSRSSSGANELKIKAGYLSACTLIVKGSITYQKA